MTDRIDNFNRADTAVALGTPSDSGSSWVETTFGGISQWGITSNKAYKLATSASIDYAVLDAADPNAAVQFTVVAIQGVTVGGIVARYVDAGNHLLAQFDGGGNLVTYKRVAGSYSSIASFAGSVADGDVLKMTCDASNLISTYRNGVLGSSVTEAANSAGTLYGIESQQTGTTSSWLLDDFSITGAGGGGGGTVTGSIGQFDPQLRAEAWF